MEPLKKIKAKIADGNMVFKIDDNEWSDRIPGAAGHEVFINPLEVPNIKVQYVLEFVTAEPVPTPNWKEHASRIASAIFHNTWIKI